MNKSEILKVMEGYLANAQVAVEAMIQVELEAGRTLPPSELEAMLLYHRDAFAAVVEMLKAKRRPVDVSVGRHYCLAACDDGTIWRGEFPDPANDKFMGWNRLPDIPQDPETTEPEKEGPDQ